MILKVRKFHSLLGQSSLPLVIRMISSRRSEVYRPDPNSIFYTHPCSTLGHLLKVWVGVLLDYLNSDNFGIGNKMFSYVHPDRIISNAIKPILKLSEEYKMNKYFFLIRISDFSRSGRDQLIPLCQPIQTAWYQNTNQSSERLIIMRRCKVL